MIRASKTISHKTLIGRVIVRDQPQTPASGEAMLLKVLTAKKWKEVRVKFLITPGGFVAGVFPKSWSGGIGWNSKDTDLSMLTKVADPILSCTVTKRVLRAARGKVDFLTIGIDLKSKGQSNRRRRAELIAIYEIANKRVFWTGKSYPTRDQERNLVQVANLRTHLLKLARERVLVLGCHDLNMFSPRGRASQKRGGDRWQRCKEMHQMVLQFEPRIVLHHPHITDSPNIWRTAWSGLTGEMKNLRAWASGICYYDENGSPRALLEKVCDLTQGGERAIDLDPKASRC